MSHLLFNLLLVVYFSSCTSISFVASEKLPVKVSSLKGGKKGYVKVVKKHESLLWGYFPKSSTYDVSSVYEKYNVYEVGNVSMEHTQSFGEQFISYLSFGIYIPSTITYKAWLKYKQ